jgi:hypothetical protein
LVLAAASGIVEKSIESKFVFDKRGGGGVFSLRGAA